ncbi:MAG: CotH kinase family protein [Bacteroidota bacterium]
MKKIWCFSILLVGITPLLIAQSLYNPEGITLIEITFEDANWDQTLDDFYAAGNNERLLAVVEINGESFDSVGIRYRGGATYDASQGKNPLNIKLDHIKNHDYDGYETLKLNNGAKDPSFIREVLSFEIANQYMPAPDANYAKVFVNGNYHGLYVNVENVDKDFMSNNFYADRDNTFFNADPENGASPPAGCTQGNGAALENLGTTAACYEDYYNLESNLFVGWSELIDMIEKVNTAAADVESVINVDRAIWLCAMNNLLVNLDSYLGAAPTNYYLFRDDNDRFNTLIWDLNETFGGDQDLNEGDPELTLTEMQNLEPLLRTNDAARPLLKLILQNPIYKRQYIAHYRTMLQETINNGWYATRAQELVNMIASDVISDPNKLYTEGQFNTNLNNTVTIDYNGSQIDIPGLAELMNGRLTYLLGHSEFTKTPPTISNISNVPLDIQPNSTISITAALDDVTYAYVGYRDNLTQVFQKAEMFDDGTHDDGAAGDGIYGGFINVGVEGVQFYIYAENASTDVGAFSPARAEEDYYNLTTYGDVVINEIMASNATTQADQDGEFDDWVELYNNTSSSINLNGYYLSDNANDLTKFQFPNVTIDGNSYLIIWVDSDPLQQGLHTDFKLSANGEELILSDNNLQVIDKVVFGAQTTDVSFARIPNGIGIFSFVPPTFNAPNSNPNATIDLAEKLGLEIYPNPTDAFLILKMESEETIEVAIHNMLGQQVQRFALSGEMQVDVSSLRQGMYWLSSQGQLLGKIIIK